MKVEPLFDYDSIAEKILPDPARVHRPGVQRARIVDSFDLLPGGDWDR